MVAYAWTILIIGSIFVASFITVFIYLLIDADSHDTKLDTAMNRLFYIWVLSGILLFILLLIPVKPHHRAKYYKNHSYLVTPWIYPIIQNNDSLNDSHHVNVTHSTNSDDDEDHTVPEEHTTPDDTTTDDVHISPSVK